MMYRSGLRFLLYWLLTLVIFQNGTLGEVSLESKLITDLTTRYHPQSRPRINPNDVVVVGIRMNVIMLENLDEKSQTMSMKFWTPMTWTDELLTWNKTEYGGLDLLTLNPTDVWTPVIGFPNSWSNFLSDDAVRESPLSLDNKGLASWNPGGQVATTCYLNLKIFPFDIQECFVQMTTLTDTLGKVMFQFSERNVIGYLAENGEWNVHKLGCVIENLTYNGYDHSTLKFKFVLSRYPTHDIISTLLPLLCLGLLTPFVFLLPVEAGERVSLSVTLFLAFGVFQLVLADRLPETSINIPVLITYAQIMSGIDAASVVLLVISLRFHHKGLNAQADDNPTRTVSDNSSMSELTSPVSSKEPNETRGMFRGNKVDQDVDNMQVTPRTNKYKRHKKPKNYQAISEKLDMFGFVGLLSFQIISFTILVIFLVAERESAFDQYKNFEECP